VWLNSHLKNVTTKISFNWGSQVRADVHSTFHIILGYAPLGDSKVWVFFFFTPFFFPLCYLSGEQWTCWNTSQLPCFLWWVRWNPELPGKDLLWVICCAHSKSGDDLRCHGTLGSQTPFLMPTQRVGRCYGVLTVHRGSGRSAAGPVLSTAHDSSVLGFSSHTKSHVTAYYTIISRSCSWLPNLTVFLLDTVLPCSPGWVWFPV
jgi:hypothetical protein